MGRRPCAWALGLPGLLAASLWALSAPAQAQSAERGKALYEAKCSACHSVDANRVGPMHRGVLGRRAGSVLGYDYSEALARSRIVWSRETLRAWLAGPEQLVPGQKMGYSLGEALDRADVVAYLATLK